MRIVVATDFSEHAARARDVGIALALRLRGSITLLHSVEPDPDESRGALPAGEAERRLAMMAEEVRSHGVAVDTDVVLGYAEESLAAAARRIGAGLLVVGSRSRRAPLRWVLGSIAERTLQSSELPVLVVGVAPGGFSSWAEKAHRLRVTIALESAEPAEAVFEMAERFARADACELTFVHVAPPALLAGRLRELLLQTLRKRIAGLGAKLEIITNGDSLASSLATYLADHPCDLVLVGAHARSGFDGPSAAEVARALLHHRVAPVLAVPLPPPSHARPVFHSILAPTDLSELGNRAVSHAYAIARGLSVTLLYVYVTPGGRPIRLDPEMRANLELRLLALIPLDAGLRGTSSDVLIVEGEEPAKAIVDTATRLACEVICMGSHGRTTLGRVLLGSVAEEVVHRFPKAVMLVR